MYAAKLLFNRYFAVVKTDNPNNMSNKIGNVL